MPSSVSSVLQKASKLPPDARRAVEALLGRRLRPEEHVSVSAYRPHKAPTGVKRADLGRRLEARIHKTSQKLKKLPQAELDALIDEAVDHVRHHRS